MTLLLARCDSSHDRGSCRTRTTDDIAASRSFLNAPHRSGRFRELPAANHSSQDRTFDYIGTSPHSKSGTWSSTLSSWCSSTSGASASAASATGCSPSPPAARLVVVRPLAAFSCSEWALATAFSTCLSVAGRCGPASLASRLAGVILMRGPPQRRVLLALRHDEPAGVLLGCDHHECAPVQLARAPGAVDELP